MYSTYYDLLHESEEAKSSLLGDEISFKEFQLQFTALPLMEYTGKALQFRDFCGHQ